jgi:hypothetical protein
MVTHVHFFPYDDMKLIPKVEKESRMVRYNEWDAFGKMARETGLATPDTLDDCIRDTDEWLEEREKRALRQERRRQQRQECKKYN